MFIKAVLESEGFHTMEAADGVQALELIRMLGTGLHLLISDIRMPRMDGITLARLVRADFPALPIILTSGYTTDFQDLAIEFIPKPFHPGILLSLVRKIMLNKAAAP